MKSRKRSDTHVCEQLLIFVPHFWRETAVNKRLERDEAKRAQCGRLSIAAGDQKLLDEVDKRRAVERAGEQRALMLHLLVLRRRCARKL